MNMTMLLNSQGTCLNGVLTPCRVLIFDFYEGASTNSSAAGNLIHAPKQQGHQKPKW